jgi:hypothetical protein
VGIVVHIKCIRGALAGRQADLSASFNPDHKRFQILQPLAASASFPHVELFAVVQRRQSALQTKIMERGQVAITVGAVAV